MAKKNSNNWENFFNYDLDIDNRILWLGGNVDKHMAEKAIKGLITLDMLAPTGDKPITIILSSNGGHVYDGLAVYDAIRSCKNEVTVMVYGKALSMAAWILQAAKHRVMAPSARLMIHDGSDSHDTNHPKIIERWVEQWKIDNELFQDILLNRIREKHPDFSKKKLAKMLAFDTILSPEQAVELGLADEVLK
jgi:ATP-dependent Clp protease protease subunit